MDAKRIEELTKGWEDQTDWQGDEGESLEDFDFSPPEGLELLKVPSVPHIDAAILAAVGQEHCGRRNTLAMGDWHACGTSHCRAGWAVVLSGPEGWALEKKLGAEVAGALIYRASRPGIPAPDFFANHTEALDDLRACAALDPLPAKGETA